jgi:nucleotide-binding universal stress UspA family protein
MSTEVGSKRKEADSTAPVDKPLYVLCVDTSDESKGGLDWVRSNLPPGKYSVGVCCIAQRVHTHFSHPSEYFNKMAADMNDSVQERATKVVEAVAKELEGDGYTVQSHVAMEESIATGIVEWAAARDAAGIVITRRHLTTDERAVLGSVTDLVVQRAECTVVVVH